MKFANTNRTDNGEGKPLCTCILLICCYIYKTTLFFLPTTTLPSHPLLNSLKLIQPFVFLIADPLRHETPINSGLDIFMDHFYDTN
jgi:hypothetical protein